MAIPLSPPPPSPAAPISLHLTAPQTLSLPLSPNAVPAPSGAEGGGLPLGSSRSKEWLNEGMRGSSLAMFLELTNARRLGTSTSPDDASLGPLPPAGGHTCYWGAGLVAARRVYGWFLPRCLSGRETGSLEGGASGAIGVMGSHQVHIKPVAWPWRRIPRPARLFCCRRQHLPSPTHRGPERLPRASSPRA